MGERSLHWNTKARGAFVGLTIRHTRADMIRAVLGVAMNLSIILDAFRAQCGARIDAIRLIAAVLADDCGIRSRPMSTAYHQRPGDSGGSDVNGGGSCRGRWRRGVY